MIIEQENTVRTQAENRDSDEEMSYSEMTSHLLGEFIPKRGRVITCFAIACVFLVISLALWVTFAKNYYKKGITGECEDQSMITEQKIHLLQRLPDGTLSSEVPPWIHEDLRKNIYMILSREPDFLSIYYDKQLEYVRNSLKEIYWIQEVHKITKLYPAFLEIEVTYRRPILLVRILKPETLEETGNPEVHPCCLLPLANGCYILPNDESVFPVAQGNLDQFPIFVGEVPDVFNETENPIDVCEFPGYPPPRSTFPGQVWDYDSQVVEAAEIVELLGDRWKKFGLDYICIEKPQNGLPFSQSAKSFCIVTRNGSRIHWGRRTVVAENKDEVLDVEKVEQLDKLYNQDGRLDSEGRIFNMTFRRKTDYEKKEANPLPNPQ